MPTRPANTTNPTKLPATIPTTVPAEGPDPSEVAPDVAAAAEAEADEIEPAEKALVGTERTTTEVPADETRMLEREEPEEAELDEADDRDRSVVDGVWEEVVRALAVVDCCAAWCCWVVCCCCCWVVCCCLCWVVWACWVAWVVWAAWVTAAWVV